MNGKMIGRKPLYVAVAQRKEERKTRLQVIHYISRSLFYFLFYGKVSYFTRLSVCLLIPIEGTSFVFYLFKILLWIGW